MKTRRLRVSTLAPLFGLFFLLPLIPILLWAFANQWTYPGRAPQHWGLRGITQFLDDGGVASLVKSLLISVSVAALAVPLSSAAASALILSKQRISRLVEAVLFSPAVIPPFVLVMGLSPWVIRFGIPAQLAVVITLVVLALPYSTFLMRSAYARYDQRWEEEARLLGATRMGAIARVRLPIMTRAFITAAILAFLIGWTDYIATLVIGGGQVITLPMLAASASSAPGNNSVLAIMSIVSMAIPLSALTLIRRSDSKLKNEVVSL
jgi:putative spermidine/putrescine transport system permease protein